MPLAGHAARLKISGAAVAVTAAACTSLGGGVHQVTNSARRVFNPSQSLLALIFYDAGVPISGGNIAALDIFTGTVTFTSPPVGAVTVDYEYLPVATVAEAKGVTFTADAGLQDRTTFDSAGVRQKLATLLDTSGDMDLLTAGLDDLDPVTGGVQTLRALLTNGTPKLLEVTLGSYFLRWWVVLESIETAAEVAGLVTTKVNLQGQPQLLGTSGFFGIYSISL